MKIIFQLDEMDCGPACIAMISNYYGKNYSIQYIREQSYLTKDGVSIQGIKEACNCIGLDSQSYLIDYTELIQIEDYYFPCILYWNQNHFVVLHRIKKKNFGLKQKISFAIADPAHGYIKLSEKKFKKSWLNNNKTGVAIFLKTNHAFFNQTPPIKNSISLKFILNYLKPYKNKVIKLFIILVISSLFSLVFPILTQLLIDKGVLAKNINIIIIILIAQLTTFLGAIAIEILKNWLMLYLGTKLSVSIISNFLKKMLQLPIKFFDTKMIGDLHQRIEDNNRIESFLTSQSLLTFFSLINVIVFFIVLWYYSSSIIFTYLLLTIASLIWSSYWLSKRKKLDYYSFQQRSSNQESIYEILNGIIELKINQFEDYKRKKWEEIQQNIFSINIKILKVNQIQISGFQIINQIKNILVTFLGAILVIKDAMSIGELLAISYIIGQLNSPINQIVIFFRSLQEAKISLTRLNEVQNQKPEENKNLKKLSITNKKNATITFKNVSFQYEGPKSPYVLKNISFKIPEGKVTAIVGSSGSGKTTLLKLLLRFYDATDGDIFFNDENIKNISPKSIRINSGIVMQEGYIFSDTISRNIATSDEKINQNKLTNALKIANINDFVNSLPQGINTKIGDTGNGISGGQKQRILISRAVYKDPDYLFFDEATSSLDSENEKIVHDNLQTFFKNKTVLIIAHRLSTVKRADQIIVLKDGEIIEIGMHNELVKNKGEYFNLIKNQLELGN